MSTTTDALSRLQSASTSHDRWDVARSAFAELGGGWITAASAPTTSLRPISLRTSVPEGLMRDYVGAGLPKRDRWLNHCATSPTVTGGEPQAGQTDSAGVLDRTLADILVGYGVTYVVLVPGASAARVEGLVVYATSREEAERLSRATIQSELPMLAALVTAFCAADAAPPDGRETYRFADLLSPRERETLLWLAAGLRSAEIGHRMKIETVTVGMHIQSARRKLCARTRQQALAIALRDGHITL
jgi:DNA-binding CsgD family transcriptional regulator